MTGSDPFTLRHDVGLVARREFVQRGRDKSFLISAIVTVVIILAIVILPAIFSKPTTYKIGNVNSSAVVNGVAAAAKASGTATKLHDYPDEAAARAAVSSGEVDVALIDGQRAIVKEKLKPELSALITQVAHVETIRNSLHTAGVPPAEAETLLTAAPITVIALKPKTTDDGTRQAVALFTVFLLYGQLIGYAMWVANGVVEEKASRVIEVLAATVSPRRLMIGKVLGIGGLALVQLLSVSVVAVLASVLVRKTKIPPDAYVAIGLSFAWFLAGFAFFAFLFAGAASMVSRQEDLQNIVTPLTLVLVGSMFAGLQASSNPDASLAKVLSFVPPLSSVVMPTRYAAGGVPLWQVGLSFLLLLAAVWFIVRLAGRIYANSILKGRSKWREALRRQQEAG